MHPTFRDAVFDKVVLAVEQTVYVAGRALAPDTRLVEDLKLGRFGRIRLALYLEETFDVEISDDAVAYFDTVGDVAQYMSRWTLQDADMSTGPWANS